MALRIASFLGAGCLSLQSWLAVGEVDEKEYFPLSGGIDSGVQVAIKVQSISGSNAKIEFVDRERKGAFSFDVSTAEKQITRSADAFNGPSETFGGWPAGLETGAHTFIFTKRKFDIAVSIQLGTGEVMRYPWYDYKIEQNGVSPLLTHVAVYSGLVDPEVTLTRPQCAQECHPDECRDAAGASVCEGANATGCFSVEMGAAPGEAAKCSTQKTTKPSGNMHCCDGSAVTPKARGALPKDTWAVMTSSEYLTRICTAFTISPCPTQLSGSHVQVNSSTDDYYQVFAPVALTSRTSFPDHDLPATSFFNLPRFAFFESFSSPKAIGNLKASFSESDDFLADDWNDIIVVASDAKGFLTGDLKKGYFVHVIDWNLNGVQRTTKYTTRAAAVLKFNSSVIYASAQPMDASRCTDRPGFEDVDGRKCADYAGLCTRHGYGTQTGCNQLYDPPQEAGCKLPRGTESNGDVNLGPEAAALGCCICGGGDNEIPTDWSSSATRLEVVM